MVLCEAVAKFKSIRLCGRGTSNTYLFRCI